MGLVLLDSLKGRARSKSTILGVSRWMAKAETAVDHGCPFWVVVELVYPFLWRLPLNSKACELCTSVVVFLLMHSQFT